jgi:hypothetical protein
MAYREKDREGRDNSGSRDMSKKKGGVTSAFSAATSANYSGEDITSTASDSGNDMDKMRSGTSNNNQDVRLDEQDGNPTMRPLDDAGL